MRNAAIQSLAVGFFDGVHLGHQEILRGVSAAMTFTDHPAKLLCPDKAPRLIMSLDDRVAAIKACGVDEVFVLEFTEAVANTPREEFLDFVERNVGFRPLTIKCGDDWRFGRRGEGDSSYLRSLGVEVIVAPYALYKDERVSSSRIRNAVERGEIEDVNAMLGRMFTIKGEACAGKGLGKKIGYPTLNVRPTNLNLHIPLGVYSVEVEGVKGVANYGVAPTMGEQAWAEPILEVHFAREVTPEQLRVQLKSFIRPERKFESVDDLRRQIAMDCRKAGI